mgnify:CR=1 FL=1
MKTATPNWRNEWRLADIRHDDDNDDDGEDQHQVTEIGCRFLTTFETESMVRTAFKRNDIPCVWMSDNVKKPPANGAAEDDDVRKSFDEEEAYEFWSVYVDTQTYKRAHAAILNERKRHMPRVYALPSDLFDMAVQFNAKPPPGFVEPIPRQALTVMRDYQRDTVELIRARNGHMILADDMGLGKTLLAIVGCFMYRRDWPVLVIAPKNLLDNWPREFIKYGGLEASETVIMRKIVDIPFALANLRVPPAPRKKPKSKTTADAAADAVPESDDLLTDLQKLVKDDDDDDDDETHNARQRPRKHAKSKTAFKTVCELRSSSSSSSKTPEKAESVIPAPPLLTNTFKIDRYNKDEAPDRFVDRVNDACSSSSVINFRQMDSWLRTECRPLCSWPGLLVGIIAAYAGECPLVYVVSYDLVWREPAYTALLAARFQTVVVDESHSVKHEDAKRTQAVMALTKHARRVFILSGTIGNCPADLESQIRIVQPNLFTTPFSPLASMTSSITAQKMRDRNHDMPFSFIARYCDPRMKFIPNRKPQWDFRGSARLDELYTVFSRLGVRRLKANVLKGADSITIHRKRIELELDPKELEGVQDLQRKNELARKTGKGKAAEALFTEMNSALAVAKRGPVCRFLRAQIEAGRVTAHKALIFSHSVIMHDAVRELLNELKIPHIFVAGSTTGLRQPLFDRFNFNESVRVAVLGITAVPTGVNLPAASIVWTTQLMADPALHLQGEGRAARPPQTSIVSEFLVARGTLDTMLWQIIQRKVSVSGEMLDGQCGRLSAPLRAQSMPSLELDT